MLEQRRYKRYNTEGTVILKPEDSSSRTIRTDLIDLSFLGIGVHAYEKIEAGIDVEFELKDKLRVEPIIGKGKIKYIQEIKKFDSKVFKIGIEFINVDKTAIQYILRRLQANLSIEARSKKHQFKKSPFPV